MTLPDGTFRPFSKADSYCAQYWFEYRSFPVAHRYFEDILCFPKDSPAPVLVRFVNGPCIRNLSRPEPTYRAIPSITTPFTGIENPNGRIAWKQRFLVPRKITGNNPVKKHPSVDFLWQWGVRDYADGTSQKHGIGAFCVLISVHKTSHGFGSRNHTDVCCLRKAYRVKIICGDNNMRRVSSA